jgi:hypothetical protein
VKCPNCLIPVNFARQRCPRCGVAYQAAFESRAWDRRKMRRDESKRQGREYRRPARFSVVFYLWLGATAAAALLWIFISPPAGLPMPLRATESRSHGFAYAVPAGWTVDAAELPKQGLVSAARLSNGLVKVEVLVGPSSLYDDALTGDGALRLVQNQFNGADVRLEAVVPAEVDRLPALRLRVAGGRTILPSPNAGLQGSGTTNPAPRFEALEFAGELTTVRGAGRSYLIKAAADRDSLTRARDGLDRLVDSFRVTRRPLSLAHLREVLTGAAP